MRFPNLLRLCSGVLLAALLGGCAGFGPQVVAETPSMFGTLVVTDDGDGLRSLRFGRSGITQTSVRVGDPDHLQFGYARLAMAGVALVPAPRRLLVVGLGGGSLPLYLHRRFPDAVVDAVEIDPAVLKAATTWFGFQENAHLRAHVADGRRFIEQAPAGHYDVIVLDAFGSAEVPFHLATQEFLRAVRRALAPNGVVVSNVWGRFYNRLYESMLRTYQDTFAEVEVLEAAREVNRIVVALPQRRGLVKDQWAAAGRQFGAAKGLRFDLGALIDSSLSTPAPAGGSVLRDAAP